MSKFIPPNAVIWFEIPVTDMQRAKAFYEAVLQAELTEENGGPNPMAMFPAAEKGRAGHLYPGKPAARGTGSTIHLAAPEPLEEAMERVTRNGGKVVSPVIAIPAGRFAYCEDPDGNSFGLFA
jgi:predicted enzyme related to lactoylglutathione lyase